MASQTDMAPDDASRKCYRFRYFPSPAAKTRPQFVSTIGKFVARVVGAAPGTWLSSRIQLFVGFSVSGLAHVPGDMMVDPRWTGSSYWFFLYQACAITLEDGIIAAAKRLGIRESRATRLLGYATTLTWFAYSTPFFVDWADAAGLGSHRAFRGSVVAPALRLVAEKTGVDVMGWVARQCAL